MMFDIAITSDMTARALQARDEKRGREETFVADRPSRAFEETPFLVYRAHVPSARRNGTLTPTGAELGSLNGTMSSPPKTASKEDAVDRARDARVALLARKYEGLSTVEDDARLAILTARLRKLSPRVTNADLDRLTTIVGELEQVSSNLDAIRSKFGLK